MDVREGLRHMLRTVSLDLGDGVVRWSSRCTSPHHPNPSMLDIRILFWHQYTSIGGPPGFRSVSSH